MKLAIVEKKTFLAGLQCTLISSCAKKNSKPNIRKLNTKTRHISTHSMNCGVNTFNESGRTGPTLAWNEMSAKTIRVARFIISKFLQTFVNFWLSVLLTLKNEGSANAFSFSPIISCTKSIGKDSFNKRLNLFE